MRYRLVLWILPAVLYVGFVLWYTNLSGPLTPAEIESYTARLAAGGYDAERLSRLVDFMRADTGRQFLMVNNIDMASPRPAAEDNLSLYMAHMWPALLSRACHPVFAGAAVQDAMDVLGIEGAQHWDRVALMRYRSRRDLLEIVANPAFTEKHDHKLAALDKTIAYPVEAQLYLSDPRLLLALVLLAAVALMDVQRGQSQVPG